VTQSLNTPVSLEAPHKYACPKCGRSFRRGLGSHAPKCGLTMADLFWSKVDKAAPGGCWQWTASQKERGYGQFLHNRKMHRAHRLAWTLSGRELPARPLELAHTCHNRLCVNPEHLYAATHERNMLDCKEARRHTFGARNTTAILTDVTAQQMRAEYRYENGRSNIKALAKKYGVSPVTAGMVISGRTWRHLPHTPIRPRLNHK
jgi:hypothetical protein